MDMPPEVALLVDQMKMEANTLNDINMGLFEHNEKLKEKV